MPRALDIDSLRKPVRGDRRVASSTGRAVGAALACLLVTSLVVDRSIAAVHPGEAGAATAFGAAAIALSDDDRGRSLANLSNMVPGETHRSCISVTYEGTLFPVDLVVSAEVSGSLADFVDVSLEEVAPTDAAEECADAPVEQRLYSGPLTGLAQDPIVAARLVSAEETRSYRFSFDIADDADAIGKTAGADFVWEIDL